MASGIMVSPKSKYYFNTYKGVFISAEKDDKGVWEIKAKTRTIYDKNIEKSLDYIMTCIDHNTL